MGVDPCARCPKCKSDLAMGPDGHREPRPHSMESHYVEAETDKGKTIVGTLSRCIWCNKTLAQIVAAGEPKEPAPLRPPPTSAPSSGL